MLGSELKEIREKAGLTQKKFAKKIDITQARLSQIERGILEVPLKVEKILERNIKKEYTRIDTNNIFSRELFLKDMLTGNKVIDDLYINASWLFAIDNSPVFMKKIRIIVLDDKEKEIGILKESWSYILRNGDTDFYVRKEWIK